MNGRCQLTIKADFGSLVQRGQLPFKADNRCFASAERPLATAGTSAATHCRRGRLSRGHSSRKVAGRSGSQRMLRGRTRGLVCPLGSTLFLRLVHSILHDGSAIGRRRSAFGVRSVHGTVFSRAAVCCGTRFTHFFRIGRAGRAWRLSETKRDRNAKCYGSSCTRQSTCRFMLVSFNCL